MKKAFIFDFDDTLATTDCHVLVWDYYSFDTSKPAASLTPSQFNTHKLQSNQHYDFSEFRDEIFIHAANPTWLMALAKEVYNEGHSIYILTARSPDVADAIQMWLARHDIHTVEVYCVGGNKDTISANKKRILLDIVTKYDKIYFYDDSEENVDIFQHEKLRSYLV